VLKIKTFRSIITPAVGARLAGYGPDNISNGVHDDLLLSGIAFNDGRTKALLLSYDLIGMDRPLILELRTRAAKLLSLKATSIIVACTHTHSGPHSRSGSKKTLRDVKYSKWLIGRTLEALEGVFSGMEPVEVYRHSVNVSENINRRVLLPGNRFAYLPDEKHLKPVADGVTDPELGMLFFMSRRTGKNLASIINYSAHPLASQRRGGKSLKITSDYPGALRKTVEKKLGGFCVFTTGACGDLHPYDYEGGFRKMENLGRRLGLKVSGSLSRVLKTEACRIKNPEVETRVIKVPLAVNTEKKKHLMPLFENRKTEAGEVVFLRIGDVCFAGVPGELLAEPGLEIKWNSPFKKTYILYNSTGYLSYMPHANAFVNGGYEADTSQLRQFETFKLVNRVVREFKKWKLS